MIKRNKIYNADCFSLLPEIPDKSIDFICIDPPYASHGYRTACKWDKEFPLDKMWEQVKRIIKPQRAIAIFATQPFTSALIMSNTDWWKYNWVWRKSTGPNFINSHYQPIKVTEDICVFGDGAVSYTKDGKSILYNPQFTAGKPYVCKNGSMSSSAIVRDEKTRNGGYITDNKGIRYPKNLLEYNNDRESYHPTQKPVELLRYLIRTYTNSGDTVLDFCMGSGSTCVAAIKESRNYIGIEKERKYFDTAEKRIEKERVNHPQAKDSRACKSPG